MPGEGVFGEGDGLAEGGGRIARGGNELAACGEGVAGRGFLRNCLDALYAAYPSSLLGLPRVMGR